MDTKVDERLRIQPHIQTLLVGHRLGAMVEVTGHLQPQQTGVAVSTCQLHSTFQLPAKMLPARQQLMAQVIGSLPPIQESRFEFQAPGYGQH